MADKQYQVHGRHFAGGREVRLASIWVWDFCHDLRGVVHGEEECFVVQSIREFLDLDAFLANSISGYLAELVHVKLDVSLGHLLRFLAHKPAASETEEIRILIPVGARTFVE
jgi:hypothetical protein